MSLYATVKRPSRIRSEISITPCPRGRPREENPTPQVQKYLDLLAEGHTIPEVARICGVTKQAVHYAAKRWLE